MATKKLCQYFYYDENDLTGLRVGDWKMSFAVKERKTASGGTSWFTPGCRTSYI
jgi:hypothetical protein